ncbi:hypothetical protein [Streptomyces chattanoogensis]|uniref:Membrane protein n=1 Tax=Streptomyces chattanoogensis TaxID=66876 RepID=A0A0N0XXY7_9ACTN|nr:hypothetical protein [Streptomyces chattanoogensis]AJT68295.1 hypothetical protein T261_6686 [Streptomyces lydicus]KPC65094.1 membrane protein [Streptomyces chattanoogensis]
MPETTTPGAAEAAAAPAKRSLGTGPGRLLVTVYGVFTVAAASRSLFQVIAQFEVAPLAYSLSAVSAVVYGFILFSLVRGGEGARKAAAVSCALELIGVLGIGTWTLAEPSAFPDQTVWSDYGMDYLFIPVVLPVTGLMWLRRARTATA